MKKRRLAVGSMLLIILSGLGLDAQLIRRNDPFSGVWKLNTTKSTTSVPAPKSVRIKAGKKGINFSEEVEGGETVTRTAEFNGKDYPVKGSSLADAAAYQRLGPRTIKSTVKQRWRTLITETMTVSEDGKRLTVSFTQFPGIAVFDRE